MKTYISLSLVGSLAVLAVPVTNAQEAPLETLRYSFEDLA